MPSPKKPIIAFTMGDYNGIGPEIILKTLRLKNIWSICTPVIIGVPEVFERTSRQLHLPASFVSERVPVPHRSRTIQIVPTGGASKKWRHPLRKITAEAGKAAGQCIEQAVALWNEGSVDAIVTAPISKEGLGLGGFPYPGHTEMLQVLTKSDNVLMIIAAGNLRVALATIHLPIRKVPSSLSVRLLQATLTLLASSLERDFSCRRPRIAVLGLNPHAGEHGLIGCEETDVIIPAIASSKRKNIVLDGPFPADGFFGTHSYRKYDAVLAMYHDQGLIPLKTIGYSIGVNFSAGLPLVRTSPDHGTAYDIAGKNIADPQSMIEATKLAVSIFHNRRSPSRQTVHG